MVLSFDVAGDPAEFEFNQATGSAEVRSSGKTVPLQNPLNPKSHFRLRTTNTWSCQVDGHGVAVTRVRPRWVAGFRQSDYKVAVDGVEVAQARG